LDSFKTEDLHTLLSTIELKPVDVEKLFQGCDPLAVDIMLRMLQLLPEKRITAQ